MAPVPPLRVSNTALFRRLLSYALPYWRRFALTVLAMVILAATETGFAMLMQPLLDGSFVERDPAVISMLPWLMLGLFFVRSLMAFVTNYGMAWIGRQVIHVLRARMFGALLQLPAAEFDQTPSGRLVSKLTYDVEQLTQATTQAITVLIRDTLTVLGLLAWMLYLSTGLALLVLMTTPLLAVIVTYVGKRFRRLSRALQASMGDLTQRLGETIDGQRLVKLYNAQPQEDARFARLNDENRTLFMQRVLTNAASLPVMEFIVAVALAIIIGIVTQGPLLETLTVGAFVSFVTAIMLLFNPLKRLARVHAELQKAMAAAESVFGLMDRPGEPNAGHRRLGRARGHVAYRGVSFTYPGAERPALDAVTFEAQPGQMVALVGRSGSGKSTLVHLLARLYEPERGEILIDGIDIAELELASLRAQIAYVGQDVTLFNDSVAANIAYGAPGPVDAHRLREAARAAQALAFIEALPAGFDTTVGNRGGLLSGGQRQRLAIARALYRDAPILILDEATSALDSHAERAVQAALGTLRAGRTSLVIAHRLSTVREADLILVFEDGRIVERGRHEALLASGGPFAALSASQLKSDVPARGGALS